MKSDNYNQKALTLSRSQLNQLTPNTEYPQSQTIQSSPYTNFQTSKQNQKLKSSEVSPYNQQFQIDQKSIHSSLSHATLPQELLIQQISKNSNKQIPKYIEQYIDSKLRFVNYNSPKKNPLDDKKQYIVTEEDSQLQTYGDNIEENDSKNQKGQDDIFEEIPMYKSMNQSNVLTKIQSQEIFTLQPQLDFSQGVAQIKKSPQSQKSLQQQQQQQKKKQQVQPQRQQYISRIDRANAQLPNQDFLQVNPPTQFSKNLRKTNIQIISPERYKLKVPEDPKTIERISRIQQNNNANSLQSTNSPNQKRKNLVQIRGSSKSPRNLGSSSNKQQKDQILDDNNQLIEDEITNFANKIDIKDNNNNNNQKQDQAFYNLMNQQQKEIYLKGQLINEQLSQILDISRSLSPQKSYQNKKLSSDYEGDSPQRIYNQQQNEILNQNEQLIENINHHLNNMKDNVQKENKNLVSNNNKDTVEKLRENQSPQQRESSQKYAKALPEKKSYKQIRDQKKKSLIHISELQQKEEQQKIEDFGLLTGRSAKKQPQKQQKNNNNYSKQQTKNKRKKSVQYTQNRDDLKRKNQQGQINNIINEHIQNMQKYQPGYTSSQKSPQTERSYGESQKIKLQERQSSGSPQQVLNWLDNHGQIAISQNPQTSQQQQEQFFVKVIEKKLPSCISSVKTPDLFRESPGKNNRGVKLLQEQMEQKRSQNNTPSKYQKDKELNSSIKDIPQKITEESQVIGSNQNCQLEEKEKQQQQPEKQDQQDINDNNNRENKFQKKDEKSKCISKVNEFYRNNKEKSAKLKANIQDQQKLIQRMRAECSRSISSSKNQKPVKVVKVPDYIVEKDEEYK